MVVPHIGTLYLLYKIAPYKTVLAIRQFKD